MTQQAGTSDSERQARVDAKREEMEESAARRIDTRVGNGYTFTRANERKVPPDWVCITAGCNEGLPAQLFETRTEDQPSCPRCGAPMCRSPYARAVPR
jgi:hypothetical protein